MTRHGRRPRTSTAEVPTITTFLYYIDEVYLFNLLSSLKILTKVTTNFLGRIINDYP
jgi:hypothetical protein